MVKDYVLLVLGVFLLMLAVTLSLSIVECLANDYTNDKEDKDNEQGNIQHDN